MSTEKYQILIVGASGKGKTFAAQNLDRETTGYINVENKPLPFRDNFSTHAKPTTVAQVKESFQAMVQNEAITTIFFDSFSAYLDILVRECRATKTGFEIWNKYNEEIGKFLHAIKACGKDIIMTAHYEILGIEGAMEKRVKSKGKEWEGTIEKEFTIVLYADSKTSAQGRPEYFFNLYQEGTSAKCPPSIFGEDVLQIPNDYKIIMDKLNEFRNQ